MTNVSLVIGESLGSPLRDVGILGSEVGSAIPIEAFAVRVVGVSTTSAPDTP